MTKIRLKPVDFDYNLPPERIAQYPLDDRTASKLLYYSNGDITHRQFTDLPSLLPEGSLLVFNDTKVFPARTFFKNTNGAIIQVFLLEPVNADVQQAMAHQSDGQWECIIGNLKKWRDHETLTASFAIGNSEFTIRAQLVNRENKIVALEWEGGHLFSQVIRALGHVPLPPYIKRPSGSIDLDHYQTVYARQEGAVAAPTAGLHFSQSIMDNLAAKKVERAYLTLHVGAGTFQPLQAENVEDHDMHSEHFEIGTDTLRKLQHKSARIAVGTTSLRTLESLYWAGVKISRDETPEYIEKLYPYHHPSSIEFSDALEYIMRWMAMRKMTVFQGSTAIMIMPGYKIRSVEGLVTNFHLPQSTLIMLVAALIGDDWRTVYNEALESDYRFLSYGDSSLLML